MSSGRKLRLDVAPFVTALLIGESLSCPADTDLDGQLTGRDIPPFVRLVLGEAPPTLVRYDYRNQMVEHTESLSGVTTTYAYDALGRRVEKVVDVFGTPRTTRYFYNGNQVFEEQDESGTTLATMARFTSPTAPVPGRAARARSLPTSACVGVSTVHLQRQGQQRGLCHISMRDDAHRGQVKIPKPPNPSISGTRRFTTSDGRPYYPRHPSLGQGPAESHPRSRGRQLRHPHRYPQ